MNFRPLSSLYSFRLPAALTYMLQSSEYQAKDYLRWLARTRDFSRVQHRRHLERTSKARLIEAFLYLGMGLELLIGIALIIYGIITPGASWSIEIGAAVAIAYPFVWAYLVVIPLELGRSLFVEPNQSRAVSAAEEIFAKHSGTIIAVAGSYGKTSMKELLKTVLGSKKVVAATSANHNVAIEHAKLAGTLSGKEDILIIEYGEGAPGDVAAFAQNTHPDMAVITGLAPAHLNKYPSLEAAARDIMSLSGYLHDKGVFVNGDSEALKPYIKPAYTLYGHSGVGEWKVSQVRVSIQGISFKLSDGEKELNLSSKLLGRHQIGPLSLSAILGVKFGLKASDIESAIANTEPYEHRMQPYELDGAWIIDDTYNGNIDGIRAGTELLGELPAKRKIYVTPGLVDQGKETKAVHLQAGKLIAAAKPDIVVLMQNSVSGIISQGLRDAGFKGELKLIDDPLDFYNHLDRLVAKGDLVLMQNDWTDNYA